MTLKSLRYVPMLKIKQGEITALKNFTSLQSVVPLLYMDDSVKDSLTTQGKMLSAGWPYSSRPILMEPALLPAEKVDNYFNTFLPDCHILPIPVTRINRDSVYQHAVMKCADRTGNGVCLRVLSEELKSCDDTAFTAFRARLSAFIDTYKIKPQDIDLILDCQTITDEFFYLVPWLKLALTKLMQLGAWRSLTLVASSFQATSGTDSFKLYKTPRVEWQVWKELHKDNDFAGISFGDYTCIGASLAEPPKYAPVSPKIRYACEDSWVLIRGQARKYEQYHEIAKQLTTTEHYCGEYFSWGDKEIRLRAERQGTTGNATTWVSIDINHHMTFVQRSLSAMN